MGYGQMLEPVHLHVFRAKSGFFDACLFSPRSGWILHTVSAETAFLATVYAHRDAFYHGFCIVKERAS